MKKEERPSCFESRPSPQEIAENDCWTCDHEKECLRSARMSIRDDRVTSMHPSFVSCSKETPPAGRKLILLTIGGIAILGPYNPKSDKNFIVAWSPLPKVPEDIKLEIGVLRDRCADEAKNAQK